ncbi:MAG: hypothetical protein AAGB31_04625 [Bdellovibrio sp.]
MKKMDELMAELGFKQEAPRAVKEAFIKHLIKASMGVNVQTPSEKEEMAAHPQKVKPLTPVQPQQLSFNFDDSHSQPSSGKKAVS